MQNLGNYRRNEAVPSTNKSGLKKIKAEGTFRDLRDLSVSYVLDFIWIQIQTNVKIL